MLTNKSVLSNIAQALSVLSSREKSLEGACTIAPLPMYHIYSYALCLGIIPAIKGHSVLIPDPRNISAFIGTIKKYQFDIFTGLNSLFVALNIGLEFLGFSLLFISAILIGVWAYKLGHKGILFLQIFYASAGIIGMYRWFG